MTAANAIINCVLAPLALVGMFALGAAIDAEPDAREESANILALQDAQAAAEAEQRRQASAYKACMSDHGPNVLAAWNFEGQLICQPKRGPAVIHSTADQARNLGLRQLDASNKSTAGKEWAGGF